MIVFKIRRLSMRIRRLIAATLGRTGQVYVADRVEEYRAMWRAAADAMGARFTEVTDMLWEIELRGKTTRILNDIVELDNAVTLDVAGMKPVVYKLLEAEGLPVPEHLVFRAHEADKANAFLKHHAEGCVVKPANGTSSGKGVTTHVQSARELRTAIVLASLFDSEMIIEPVIAGESVRILVLKGQAIHAVRRRGIRLAGDGTSTVLQLIAAHNARIGAAEALVMDRDCESTLRAQQLQRGSVPERGRVFLAKSAANRKRQRVELRTVYDEDITAMVCDDLKETAERAARALKCELAGVDFITTDVTIPLRASNGFINEINTTPGMHHHYDRSKETYPRPAIAILQAILSKQPHDIQSTP